MRRIKALRVRCEHEYEDTMQITKVKRIGDVAVIRSMNTLRMVCSKCGDERDCIVGAGFVYMRAEGVKDGANQQGIQGLREIIAGAVYGGVPE